MTPNDLVLTPRGLRTRGRYLPCVIGRGGLLSNKREGDGATPTGTHRITGLLYRADRMAAPALWAIPIGPNDLWCDAPEHPQYNQRVQTPFSASAEHLRRADPLYDLILLTDWNWPDTTPGRGSAIFLHRWRRPGVPTEGCLAFRADHLKWLASGLVRNAKLIVPEHLARTIRAKGNSQNRDV